MRALARHPDRQLLVVGLILGQDAARFHRNGRQAILEDALLDDDVGLLECRVGDVRSGEREVPAHVVCRAVVNLRATVLERLLEVHDGRQFLVVDLDQVGAVGRLALGVGQHGGHDLALVAHFFFCDREALRYVLLFRHEGRGGGVRAGKLALEVARRIDAGHAWRLACVGDVDALDARVSVGAAHKCDVCRALAREVIDVMAVPCDQAGIFAAVDLRAYELADRHVSSLPP